MYATTHTDMDRLAAVVEEIEHDMEVEDTMEAIGTIIEGTFRTEDLIPAFMDELQKREPSQLARIKSQEWEFFTYAEKSGYEKACVELSSHADYVAWECLFEALDNSAPEGTFFGAHPGNGSDFGYWPVEMSEEF